MYARKSRKLKGRDHWGNLSLDGTTVLKYIVKYMVRDFDLYLSDLGPITEYVSAVMNIRIK